MNKVIGLIPARSGSERVLNKNIKKIGEHPLIAYSIHSALESELFDEVVVSTDSDEIANIAIQYGATVPELRPVQFSQSSSPDFDWVNLAINNWMQLREEDIFAILRPTNPLRTAKTIIAAYRLFEQNHCDSLRAIRPVKEHPGKMWRRSDQNLITPFSPGLLSSIGVASHSSPLQTLETLWVQDASLEIGWVRTIRKSGTISGEKVFGFEMPGAEGFDINYESDFEYLEFLVSQQKVKLPKIRKI